MGVAKGVLDDKNTMKTPTVKQIVESNRARFLGAKTDLRSTTPGGR